MCWLDAHEFKSIPTDDYRRSKAIHIYHKYIKPGAVLEIGGIDSHERDRIFKKIEDSKNDASVLKSTLLDRVQVIYIYFYYYYILLLFSFFPIYFMWPYSVVVNLFHRNLFKYISTI